MLGIKHVFVVLPAPSSISTHPKFILGAIWKHTLKGKWYLKNRNPRSYHPKLTLQVFEKKQQKENELRKEGIHDLVIQSSVLQVFEKNAVKGKGDEKNIEKKESTIDHPKFSLVGFWKENCERKRRWEKYRKVGIQDRASKEIVFERKSAWEK